MRAKFDLPYGVQWISELNFTDIFNFTYDNGGVIEQYAGTQVALFSVIRGRHAEYRANWQNSFTYRRLNVTGTLYYVSPYKETGVDVTGSSSACLYTTPSGAPVSGRLHGGRIHWDFDLTGRYKVNERLEIYADIANLFDAKPPLDPANFAAGANGFGMNYNPTYSQAGSHRPRVQDRPDFHVKY